MPLHGVTRRDGGHRLQLNAKQLGGNGDSSARNHRRRWNASLLAVRLQCQLRARAHRVFSGLLATIGFLHALLMLKRFRDALMEGPGTSMTAAND